MAANDTTPTRLGSCAPSRWGVVPNHTEGTDKTAMTMFVAIAARPVALAKYSARSSIRVR